MRASERARERERERERERKRKRESHLHKMYFQNEVRKRGRKRDSFCTVYFPLDRAMPLYITHSILFFYTRYI